MAVVSKATVVEMQLGAVNPELPQGESHLEAPSNTVYFPTTPPLGLERT